MSKGWLTIRPKGWAARLLLVPPLILFLFMMGCAQDPKRKGMFGEMAPKPLFPKASANRPEPKLQVRAPGVDVKVADREKRVVDGEGTGVDIRVGQSDNLPAMPSRMGLFRSASSSRSLEQASPIN